MISRVYAVYFSPAGSTGAVAEHIAGTIAGKCNLPCKVIDFTLPKMRKEQYSFDENDLVIFGMPTYAGRIPNKALPFVHTLFEGNQVPQGQAPHRYCQMYQLRNMRRSMSHGFCLKRELRRRAGNMHQVSGVRVEMS